MSLFGALVRTMVNTALLPVAAARDVVTLGGTLDENGRPHLADAIDQLKREASDD